MVCSYAGDIKGLEQIYGHAGPGGKFNCCMCDVVLHETYQAGIPHLRELPEPWKSRDVRPEHIINPPLRGGTAEMAAQARLYESEAASKKDLSSGDERFKSCIHEPLARSNDLNEHTTRTPLHVSLGKGTNYVKAVEHRAAQRDIEWAMFISDPELLARWEEAQAASTGSLSDSWRPWLGSAGHAVPAQV